LTDRAIILAGGKGTRLKELVSDRPKPMADINGKPFLYHQLKFLKRNRIKHFIICTGYKGEYIKNYFGNDFYGCSVNYSHENKPLGTGGAVIKALNDYKIIKPFILLNGDTYFPIDIGRLISFSYKKNAGICFSLFETSDYKRYLPLSLTEDGKLNIFLDQNFTDYSGLYNANGGIYFIQPKLLKELKIKKNIFISLENEIFPLLFKNNSKIMGIKFNSSFIDIGLPNDLKNIRKNMSLYINKSL
tara:strand:- start:1462 stop:2196 length:735 start_codon:yes stop_codon:yes gene_type:complete